MTVLKHDPQMIEDFINHLYGILTEEQKEKVSQDLKHGAMAALLDAKSINHGYPADRFGFDDIDRFHRAVKLEHSSLIHYSFSLETKQIFVVEYSSENYPSMSTMIFDDFEHYWKAIYAVDWISGEDAESKNELYLALTQKSS